MTHSEPSRTARAKLWPLAALAMIVLIGAGCSGTSDDTGTGGTAAAVRQQAMEFAGCMRENGVREFPDPDANGEMTIDGVLNDSSLDPDGPAWKQAMGACEDLQPPGFTGDERTAEEQRLALEFAQCMRDNGVEDFPDPASGDPLVDTNRIPSANQEGGMTVLNSAMQRCGDVAESLLQAP